MTTQEDREQAAATWLIELEDPACSPEMLEAFKDWLAASMENRRTYRALARSWERTLILRRKPQRRPPPTIH